MNAESGMRRLNLKAEASTAMKNTAMCIFRKAAGIITTIITTECKRHSAYAVPLTYTLCFTLAASSARFALLKRSMVPTR